MPKNGQVTVLLFREGDKVNVYHVLEKPDGSFSPISNDQSPLSSSPGQFGLWNFFNGGSRLVRFLTKCQPTPRKLLHVLLDFGE